MPAIEASSNQHALQSVPKKKRGAKSLGVHSSDNLIVNFKTNSEVEVSVVPGKSVTPQKIVTKPSQPEVSEAVASPSVFADESKAKPRDFLYEEAIKKSDVKISDVSPHPAVSKSVSLPVVVKKTIVNTAKPQAKLYEVTYGIREERIKSLLQKVFDEMELSGSAQSLSSKMDAILKTFFSKKDIDSVSYYCFNPSLSTVDLSELAQAIDGLTLRQRDLLADFVVETYNFQAIEDIDELLKKARVLLDKDHLEQVTEKELFSLRNLIQDKITWFKDDIKDVQTLQQEMVALKGNWEENIRRVGEMAQSLHYSQKFFELKQTEKILNARLNSPMEESVQRIQVIEGKIVQPIEKKDDNLNIQISKDKAQLTNLATGQIVKFTFGETAPVDTGAKILFQDESKDMLRELGVNVEDYSTIAKEMPFLKYMGQDKDMPEHKIMGEYYEAYMNWLKDQKHVPPELYKHLNNIRDFWKSNNKSKRALCMAAVAATAIYMAVRLVGVAGVLVMGSGDTALLDRLGAVNLLIGEFSVRLRGAYQYNHIIAMSLARETERFTATPKELDDVRGEKGPIAGMTHFMVTMDEGNFKKSLETGFLTSLGYWNFSAHHFSIGVGDFQKKETQAFIQEKEKLMRFISDMNCTVKESWLDFENQLIKTLPKEPLIYQKALQIDCLPLPNSVAKSHLQLLKKEYKRLADVYTALSQKFREKETFWRVSTNELTNSEDPRAKLQERVAEIWAAHAQVLENKAKDCLRYLKQVESEPDDKKPQLIATHLQKIRAQYRDYEHKFHHQVVLFFSRQQRRLDLPFFNLVESYLKEKLPKAITTLKLRELLDSKHQTELGTFKKTIEEASTYFNCDKMDLDKILKALSAKYADSTVDTLLPQFIFDGFYYFDFMNKGKGEDQCRNYERYGKTFYTFFNVNQNYFEIPETEFNHYLETYLHKASFTKEEWDAITPQDWAKFGRLTQIFPTKPERVEWPQQRFQFSIDTDYISSSIDPSNGQQSDFSEMVVYQMRCQKEGQVNIAVQQSKQNYLYNIETEKLAGAANNDQKPWYGSFVFSAEVEQLFLRLQKTKETLDKADQQQEYLKILSELAFYLKVLDEHSAVKLWPQAAFLLTKKSTLGLTEKDIDELLKMQLETRPETLAKLDYDVLNFWIGNLYQFLLEQRQARGMAVGKDIDKGMFNCGTCRLEDIEIHRLAIQYFQIQNASAGAGRTGQQTHALVTMSNETGDIMQYLPRERTFLADVVVNPIVDLSQFDDSALAQLLQTYFAYNIAGTISIKRNGDLIELYDANGKRIYEDYEVKLEHHPEYFAGDYFKRMKLFISKKELNPDGSLKHKIPHKVIYQYYKDTDISLAELEAIFGVQETRPKFVIGVEARDTQGMIKRVQGILYLKPKAGTKQDQFLFDSAIQNELDLEVALRHEPKEVVEGVKKLFKKYKQERMDVGTVIEDYTAQGKVITDYVPRLKNTRYVTHIENMPDVTMLQHTAGTTDITTAQIFSLLEQMSDQQLFTITTSDLTIQIKREAPEYHVDFIWKDGRKDTFVVKGDGKQFSLIKNDTEKEVFPFDDKEGVSVKYECGAKQALAGKIKQAIMEKEFIVDFGLQNIDSATTQELLNNKHLLNRTIYLGNRVDDRITFSGRSVENHGRKKVIHGLNASFPMTEAVSMKFDGLSKETEALFGTEVLRGLKRSDTRSKTFILMLLDICAKSAEQEYYGKDVSAIDANGYEKKGAKWANIILTKHGQIDRDLRISYVTKANKRFVMLKDVLKNEEIVLPLSDDSESNFQNKDFLDKLIEYNQNRDWMKTLDSWFSNSQVDVLDLQYPALKHLLKLRFGDNVIQLKKSRDRSNLSLMLLNIRQLAPVGQFKFIKKVQGQEQIHILQFSPKQVVLDGVPSGNYEAAMLQLDQLLFDGNGDVTIESTISMPRIVSKMIKTDSQGNTLFERVLPTPKEDMPDPWITEDAASTFEQTRRGFKVIFAPYRFADGLGPDSVYELANQHRRWALGTIQSFSAEELKKHPLFMKSRAGHQLENNENWYKHGPLDEALYNAPIALANSLIATELSGIDTFNPIAPDNSTAGSLSPLSLMIVFMGLIVTMLNVLVYYNDMKNQPTAKKKSTSMKDIFIKESLIGFFGSNTYKDAYELDIMDTKLPFDITQVGGGSKPQRYEYVKATNERLIKSLYASSVFSALLIKTLATQGYMTLINPITITILLVGFWSYLNAAKLLTGIAAFDGGFESYWNSWKEGFKNDAENKTMEIHNERAQLFNSLGNIETGLAIAENRILGRLANGKVPISKPNIGNFSRSLDYSLKRVLKNPSSKTVPKALELILRDYRLAGQPKVVSELMNRLFSADKNQETLEQFQKAIQASLMGSSESKTMVTAHARSRQLFEVLQLMKGSETLQLCLKQSPQIYLEHVKSLLDMNMEDKAIEAITQLLEQIDHVQSGERAKLYSRAERLLIESYQRKCIRAIKDPYDFTLVLAKEVISGKRSPEVLQKELGLSAAQLAPLMLLRTKIIGKNSRKAIREIDYNSKHFNQAQVFFKKYFETKEKAYLNLAYDEYTLLTHKTVEMETLGSSLIGELVKINTTGDLRNSLKERHLEEINRQLKRFYFTDSLKIVPTVHRSFGFPSLILDRKSVVNSILKDVKTLNHLLGSLKTQYHLRKTESLAAIIKILQTSEIPSSKQKQFLTIINRIEPFLPDLNQLTLNQSYNISLSDLTVFIRNAVKEGYFQLKSQFYRVMELSNKEDFITFTRQSDHKVHELKTYSKAVETHQKGAVTISYVPNKGYDLKDEKKLWADQLEDQESDFFLRYHKNLLRKLMGIADKVDEDSLEGISSQYEQRLAKQYVLEKNKQKSNYGFLNADYQNKKADLKPNADQVLDITRKIIKRLTALGRYDEALRFYSYYIPTLKLPRILDEVSTVGEFVEAATGFLSEKEKLEDLKDYFNFLAEHKDQFTLEGNAPIGFIRVQEDYNKKTKITSKTTHHRRSVYEEMNNVKTILDNLTGETIGHKEVQKAVQAVANNTVEFLKKEFIKNPSVETFLAYFQKMDMKLAEDIVFYLREDKKEKLSDDMYQALNTIRPSIKRQEFIEIMSIYAKKISEISSPDKNLMALKTHLEAFFSNLQTMSLTLSETDKEEIEKLAAHYLLLQSKGVSVNFKMVQSLYEQVLKQSTEQSAYLQSVGRLYQDTIEDHLANELLLLKSKLSSDVAVDPKIFNATLQKVLTYYGFFTNTLYPQEKTTSSTGLKEIQDWIEFVQLTHTHPFFKPEKLMHLLSELADVSQHYQATMTQKQYLMNAMISLADSRKNDSIKHELAYQLMLLKAEAILNKSQHIDTQWKQLVETITQVRRNDFDRLSKVEREQISQKAVETVVQASLSLLQEETVSKEDKLKAAILADQVLTQYLNDSLSQFSLSDQETIRWQFDLMRLEIRSIIFELTQKGVFQLDDIQQLRKAGVVGYSQEELNHFASSALTLFTQKIDQLRQPPALHQGADGVFDATKYLLPQKNRTLIESYQNLANQLMQMGLKYQIFCKPTDVKVFTPSQKKALDFISQQTTESSKKSVAVNHKTISLSSWDQIKFAEVSDHAHFQADNFKTDEQKINEIYAKKFPKIYAIGFSDAVKKPTFFELWKRQKVSALQRFYIRFKIGLQRKKLYWTDKVLNHAVLWGSIGLLMSPFVMMIPGVTAALGGTFGLVTVCTLGGIIVLPILWHYATKAFWSIYSTVHGYKARKETSKRL